MKPCISEATTMPGTFAEDVAAFAEAGFTGMEVWLTKLENHLAAHSASATRKLLEDRNMTLAAASYQGGLLMPPNLGFVQVCDLAGVPRELATDGDRILPGDGDFQLQPILAQLQAAGYDGWVSLELLNPGLWQTNAVQVAAIGYQAVQRLLENAC